MLLRLAPRCAVWLQMGKLKVHRSGTLKLHLGDVAFDMTRGIGCEVRWWAGFGAEACVIITKETVAGTPTCRLAHACCPPGRTRSDSWHAASHCHNASQMPIVWMLGAQVREDAIIVNATGKGGGNALLLGDVSKHIVCTPDMKLLLQ